MKIKRFIILVFIAILCSGCDVEYHVDFDEKMNANEEIKLVATTDEDSFKFDKFKWFVPIDKDDNDLELLKKKDKNIDYYDVERDSNSILFKNKILKNTYIDSTIVNSAYDYISIVKMDNKQVVLSTGQNFLLFDSYDNLENVKVVVTSKYKLLDTNADEIDTHKYIWYINRGNAKGKDIYLLLDITSDDRTFLEKLKEGDYINIFTISMVLFLVGIVIFIILKKKGEFRDKI